MGRGEGEGGGGIDFWCEGNTNLVGRFLQLGGKGGLSKFLAGGRRTHYIPPIGKNL